MITVGQRYRRIVSYSRFLLNELYKQYNGGIYRNIDAAKLSVFWISRSKDSNIYGDENITTTVVFDMTKKEIKMRGSGGLIRTIRYK